MKPQVGDARSASWPDGIQAIVTSPPYWGQRDYGFDGQIGMEETWVEYVDTLVGLFERMRPSLRDDGVLWLNLGDTFNTRAIIRPSAHQGGLGHDNESIRLTWAQAVAQGKVRYSARQPGLKDKDLMGLPHRVASALVEAGWYLRCDVIWSKTFCTPENAKDRPTRSHEYLFLLSKGPRYFYDKAACPEGHRSVWEIPPASGEGEHATAFPDELVRRCVALTTRPFDLVVDPFMGSGTTGRVAEAMGRRAWGLDGREWGDER